MYTLPPRSRFSSSVGNGLFNSASLDLPFAKTKSLVDAVTGSNLVTHTRASRGTYVGSDGLIKTATTNLLTYSEDFSNAIWSSVSTATITTSTGIDDPQGTNTAATVTNVSGANLHRLIAGTAGTPYTYSVWLRRRNGSGPIYLVTGDNIGVEVNVTNEWTRVSVTNVPTTSTIRAYVFISNTNDSVDIWGAQVEQSSTVGEYIPTTITINSAPRFNHEITRTTTNLLLQSEDFSTTWTRTNISAFGFGSVVDAITAPDATLTADLIAVANGLSAGTGFIGQVISKPASAITYTYSAFAKADYYNRVGLHVNDGATNNNRATVTVSLVNGTITSAAATAGLFSAASADVQALPDGWYRIALTFTTSTETSLLCRLYPANSSADVSDGTRGIYLWGAQLEQNSDVGPYVKTTGTTATQVDTESLGLLVEESKTNYLIGSESFAGWTVASNGLTQSTASSIAAPNGQSGAVQLFTEDLTTGVHRIFIAPVTGQLTQTHSVFVKAAAGTREIYLSSDGPTGIRQNITFDLQTGSFVGSTGGWSDPFITPYPNGWYRIGGTITDNGSSTLFIIGLNNGTSSYPGDGTSGIYLWGAQLEAGSFPTSYIPTEGTTVTRAADVASISGNNFGTTNLLQYSEEFDNAAWNNVSGTVTRNANATVAPDGTLTADELVFPSADVGVAQSLTILSGATYTVSIWIKGTAGQTIRFTANSIAVPVGTPSNVTLTGEWTRYSFTNVSTGTSGSLNISTFGGATARNIYVWGAQLEQSDVATPYVKSNVSFTSRASSATYYDANGTIQTAAVDEARTNAYLPDGSGNFVSAGELLLEDAGTNLATYSEDFASWGAANTTVTSNDAVAPDGTSSADKLTFTGAGYSSRFQTIGTTAATVYTLSVFAKAGSTDKLGLEFRGSGILPDAVFTLSGQGSTSNSNVSTIKYVGNGWYRCTITETSVDTSELIIIGRGASGSIGDTLYLWGAQLEASPYATSYIPTAGSTVTRAADVSSSSSGFGNSWYRQDEGTVYYDGIVSQGLAAFPWFYNISDGTPNNSIGVYQFTNGIYGSVVTSGVAATPDPSVIFLPVPGSTAKHALAVKALDTRAALNNALSSAQLNTVMPVVNTLSIGQRVNGNRMTGTIRRLTYWPQRLPNETLQGITQ